MQIMKDIDSLIAYAVKNGLIEDCDRVWAVNRLLEALHLREYIPSGFAGDRPLEEILASLCTERIAA